MKRVRSRSGPSSAVLAIALAFAGLFGQSARAANLTFILRPVSNDYMTQGDYINEVNNIIVNGAWMEVFSNTAWIASGQTVGVPNNEQYVRFWRVRDYYLQNPSNLTLVSNNYTLTDLYRPYSNTLTVAVAGLLSTTSAVWQLTAYPQELTNSSTLSSGLIFTNTISTPKTLSLLPTGTYTVTFGSVLGYNAPAAQSTNISVNRENWLTGTYTRTFGTIAVDVTPTNGAWTFTSYPADYTNYTASPLSGTNDAILTNTPVGAYTIQFLPVMGYDLPSPVTVTKTNSSLVTTTFEGIYSNGWRLTVHIMTTSDTNLAGLGSGSVVVTPTNAGAFDGVETWYFSKASSPQITITAYPSNVNGANSFFFKWAGDISGMTPGAYVNPLGGIMNQDRNIQLLFSREWSTNDNVGDIDGDGLPDEWELDTGLNPLVRMGDDGANGNPDGDFIPSSGTVPPTLAQTVSNIWTYTGQGTNAGYPLTRTRLLSVGTLSLAPGSLGYATGVKFDNFLECRGLDGWYLTNTPPGLGYASAYGDDPMTDPKNIGSYTNGIDTDSDSMSDGWEYYFWYWRSASAFAAGISNSANLSWVHISPSDTREINQTDGDADTEGDAGVNIGNDLNEFQNGTDPTHADTDSDGMDDTWERTLVTPAAASNALDYGNYTRNIDADFYAMSSNMLLLTTGLVTGGTAFTNPVAYSGPATNPVGAWVNVSTNTGTNVFDIFRDIIIKADAALTNGQAGAVFSTNTVYYGTNAGLGAFQQGYPVWVDMNGNTNFDAGDLALVNPPVKHEVLYLMPPASPGPAVCSFSPMTAWTNSVASGTNAPGSAPDTAHYSDFQEYVGGDYIGRLAWDAAGRVFTANDNDLALTRRSYTLPASQDSDSDLMPDGWELYVGLNPQAASDAAEDGEDPGGKKQLINQAEWANSTHPLGNVSNTWADKHWPTDPGVLTAPSPNDPHPMDTDYDGLTDAGESGLDPCSFDTDGDGLPDGWESYSGTTGTNTASDIDNDGLSDRAEYLTGAIAEWMYCDPSWNINFGSRDCMSWDPKIKPATYWPFIPPDFLTDPGFMLANGIYTNLGYLRTNYPAARAWGAGEYHTTLATDPDSDRDGMDDYWEVYHGLNPCLGRYSLMMPTEGGRYSLPMNQVGELDADPGAHSDARDFQVGFENDPFTSLAEFVVNLSLSSNARPSAVDAMVGPFNCGMLLMDPDADGLPNIEEYSFSSNLPYYHTDPSPLWRTDPQDSRSFIRTNHYMNITVGNTTYLFPFPFEGNEGFDTDHDGRGDYSEINSAMGETGDDPLDARNPIRNRALYLNGTNDFSRPIDAWIYLSAEFLTRFSVEAWVKPDNPTKSGEQVVTERASLSPNPFNQSVRQLSANYRLGITNGLPFIMYNGRGSLRAHQATAALRHQLQPGTNWTHIAGTYDGTNLIIYVNGENSASVHTEEIPDNGIDAEAQDSLAGRASAMIIGATDTNVDISGGGNYDLIRPYNYFGGCLDEVRVWFTPRTQGEIIANKDRRLTWGDISNSALVVYCNFDDVPDPNHRNSAGLLDEPVAPNYLAALDTSLKLHPPHTWWSNLVNRSTVYTGVNGRYNYIVYAQNLVSHLAQVPPFDDRLNIITNTSTNLILLPEGYKNTSNPYGLEGLFRTPIQSDFYLWRGARAVATNSWLSGLTSDPDSTDSDGDGLPDWWEQKYLLDPNDATGNNGTWGDPDNDGLNNRAEYLAGTDPFRTDTAGNGIGDYDSPRGTYSRTYGELYTDGDCLPDVWESQNGLDPQKYDANLDLDGDGWSNYAEYQAGTNPNDASSHPSPSIGGTVRYYGFLTSGAVQIQGFQTNTMDGPVTATGRTGTGGAGINATEIIGRGDGVQKIFSGQLLHGNIVMGSVRVRRLNPVWLTPDYDFGDDASGNWVFYWFYTASVNANDMVQFNYVTGAYTFTWPTGDPNFWDAPWEDDNIFIDYQWQDVDQNSFRISGFKEGDVYFYGYRDINGNSTWDAGEPAGLLENQPLSLNWSIPSGDASLGLSDIAQGYGRFAWTASTTTTNAYQVVINKISESGAPTILQRSMQYPRNYFHEWDYQLAGFYGLTAGTYQWWVGSQNGTFSVNWPASLTKPALVYPLGDIFYFAQNRFVWTMDNNSTRYHLQVAKQASDGGLGLVIDNYYPVPYRDNDGLFRDNLPLYLSELGNGNYFWRIASWNPQAESDWSDAQSFQVNLSTTNSRWITGDIYYFGKVPANNIIVEAFDNRGFSGLPDSRAKLTLPGTTNWVKSSYTLSGLAQGFYYVRAFLDVTPAGGTEPTGKLDAWKSWGFFRDPSSFYQPGLLDLSTVQFRDAAKVVIRDRDTDNDELPDAWEVAWFGDLDQTAEMDYDGDGETNLEEYLHDGLNLNPASWDTDGDGLSDAFEPTYSPVAFGHSVRPKAQSGVLNPDRWDTDGDGYSDGSELLRYHTDPLDVQSLPAYWPLCFDAWGSPGDYDGDGRSDVAVYDVNAGIWHLVTMAGEYQSLPFGITRVQPFVGDFDGDGQSEFGLYDPAQGLWMLYSASLGQSATLLFGDASMLPVPGDYSGDGRADPALFDTDSGVWHIYEVWSGQLFSIRWGSSGMIPVPGDYNGDGAADLAVYERASGNWLIGSFHKYYRSWSYFAGTLGGPTWLPVPGDYDGDGRNDLCLFESASGRWMLLTHTGAFLQGTFGWAGCVPVPGDYDGDGRTDVAIYDTNTGMWYIACWSSQYYQGRFGSPDTWPILTGRF